jgi:hypothetical protein
MVHLLQDCPLTLESPQAGWHRTLILGLQQLNRDFSVHLLVYIGVGFVGVLGFVDCLRDPDFESILNTELRLHI